MNMKNIITVLLLLVLGLGAHSQGYEIRVVHKGGGFLGVQMRMTAATAPTTADYITDIVFGLKWNSSSNAALSNTIATTYNLKKAGPRGAKGTYFYQAFYSDPIGFTISETWTAGNWIELMSLSISQASGTVSSFELCEAGFDVTTTPNLGVNFTDFSPLVQGGAAQVALPVILSKFEATPRDTYIQLAWTTDAESNNKGFEVQRSQDGINFTPVGWVDGKGHSTTPSTYNFPDRQVIAGIKYYYRLRQVDLDGREAISLIKSAQLRDQWNSDIILSPNPAIKLLHLQFRSADITGMVALKIFTAAGEKLIETNTTVRPGSGYDVPVGHLPQGTYYLVAYQADKIIFQKGFQKM